MNYFKISVKRRYKTQEQVIGHANGEFVPNARYYFDRIGNGEIIDDAPVFDYFHLESYGPKEEWEWKLQDVHSGIGEYPTGGSLFISDKSKKVLEKFNITIGFHFYPTKLLYKAAKLDYWLFQYGATSKGLNHTMYIDYPKSVFFDEQQGGIVKISDYSEFKAIRDRIGEETDYEKRLIAQKTVLNQAVDFIPFFGINSNGTVVSQKLKLAIEDAGLIGFEFSEVDYEIDVGNLG